MLLIDTIDYKMAVFKEGGGAVMDRPLKFNLGYAAIHYCIVTLSNRR